LPFQLIQRALKLIALGVAGEQRLVAQATVGDVAVVRMDLPGAQAEAFLGTFDGALREDEEDAADGRLLTLVVPHGKGKTCHPQDIRRLLEVLGL
jgi:hypothetical protein